MKVTELRKRLEKEDQEAEAVYHGDAGWVVEVGKDWEEGWYDWKEGSFWAVGEAPPEGFNRDRGVKAILL